MAQGQAPAALSALTKEEAWPSLPLAEWEHTRATLHMWTQMAGKVALGLGPRVNHCWAEALHISPRGLTTLPIPYVRGIFTVEFDFVDHRLRIATSRGEAKIMELAPRSVADFYGEFTAALESLKINAKIWPMPVEIPNPIRFDQNTQHASYDPAYANCCWRILTSVATVFQEFRARFIGKASPVHFFWGSFDLAASRFSGRRAPERPGADAWTRESYSHEVSSVGWWPGQGGFDAPMFYAYISPEPEGFRTAPVRPAEAHYEAKIGEFLLPYDEVRNSPDPKSKLLDFCQTTYEAAANFAKWDRAALERQP
jgi:hypothetical protein